MPRRACRPGGMSFLPESLSFRFVPPQAAKQANQMKKRKKHDSRL
jgi:hypothetical protein